jgi:hypothetical protein
VVIARALILLAGQRDNGVEGRKFLFSELPTGAGVSGKTEQDKHNAIRLPLASRCTASDHHHPVADNRPRLTLGLNPGASIKRD